MIPTVRFSEAREGIERVGSNRTLPSARAFYGYRAPVSSRLPGSKCMQTLTALPNSELDVEKKMCCYGV